MPPRKSDSSRRGDVSMAQFVYDGDDMDVSATSQSIAPTAKPTSVTEMDTEQRSDSAAHHEKERDKKDTKDSSKETVSIEDLNLPKSIITRLAKGVLPPNTQIQANAILAMSKSATVFVNHLANAANEHTRNASKKTIMPNDVFAALEDIEFDFMRDRLEAEFQKFNEVQTTKRTTYRRKVAAAKKADKAKAPAADVDTSLVSTATTTDAGRAPRSKKQKTNAPDDSAMDVDADTTRETHDVSDAEIDLEQEHEDDEDEDENDGGEEEEEEEEEAEEDDNEEEQDHLEEQEEAHDDDDEALDHEDS
ncbi:histone-fold-containing protein, partial [Xylariaceae sp. FL0662B]